jgi:hypothetical protein
MTCTGATAITSVCAMVLALLASAPARGNGETGSQTPPGGAPEAGALRPDLVVQLAGPAAARPGEDIGEHIRLTVANAGTAPAWGTRDHPSGFMVDLTLGRDALLAVGFKAYSPHYAEDVLLEGGRVSKTTDLAHAAARRYAIVAVIPADVPPGRYHLCAYVDPGNSVAEANERNNSACAALRIVPALPVAQIPVEAKRLGGTQP